MSIYQKYINVFKLSPSQVSAYLQKSQPQCSYLSDCKLEEGDILIRRYITQKTWLINAIAHPYFTHSAMYLGDDKIIEATGYEKRKEDEIIISDLSKSDWYNKGIESWIIVRAKNISSKADIIKKDMEAIANDPKYRFGLPKDGSKRLSCSDLILNPLTKEGLVKAIGKPDTITPDYLFWLAVNSPDQFEILGYNI